MLDRVLLGAVLLLIVSLGFQKPAVYVAGQLVNATDALFVLCFALLALTVTLGRPLASSHSYLFLSLYVAAFLFASLFAADVSRSLVKSAATLYLIILAVLTFNVLNTETRIKFAVIAWLTGALVPVLVGLAAVIVFYVSPTSSFLQYLTYHYGAVPVGNYPRVSSIFVSASMFCNYLNVTLTMLFIAWAGRWIGVRVFAVGLGAILACSLFTISSGLGATALAAALWYWIRNRTRKPLASWSVLLAGSMSAVLFLAGSIVALQPHSTATFSVPLFGYEVYPSGRLMVWIDATRNLAAHPFAGVGPGFAPASVIFQNTDGRPSLLTDAHNVLLSVAAQTGLPGLSAVVALFAYLLLKAKRAITAGETVAAALAVALLTAFAIQGLTGAFEDARHLWVLAGMFLAATRNAGTNG